MRVCFGGAGVQMRVRGLSPHAASSGYIQACRTLLGLAMVLTFIGAKMLIAPWYHVPVAASLAIVAVLIGASVAASLIATRNGHKSKGNVT